MTKRRVALLLDWGGVVIDDPSPGLLRVCADALGVTETRLKPALDRYGAAFQCGWVTEAEFWQLVCAELGAPAPREPSLWGRAFGRIVRPRADVLTAVGELRRRGVRTGLLSNTEHPVIACHDPRNYRVFDELVFSCVEGIAKPAARLYRLAVDRLGVAPGETLFIDDRRPFVEAARAVGLQAECCRTVDEVLTCMSLGFGRDYCGLDCG